MASYNELLNSILNRSYICIFIYFLLFLFVLLLVWLVPYLDTKYRKNTKKKLSERKAEKIRKEKKKQVLSQIAVTIIFFAVFSLVLIPRFKDIGNIKKDIELQSYETYSGNYYLNYDGYTRKSVVLNDLIVDVRTINIDGTDEMLLYDMAYTWKGFSPDHGNYSGTIVYGENSRYVVEIK